MVSLQLYNASGKGVRQEKETFAKQIEMTLSRAQESASQVFSSENDIGNFVGVPLSDADRRKVCYCLIAGPLLQVSRFHM